MSKIEEIINGYGNLLRSKVNLTSEDEEALFKARMDVCNACPKKENLLCTKCGCVLLAKTKSVYSECPLGHW